MKNSLKLRSISSGTQIISHFKEYFNSVPDHRKGANCSIALGDILMSAYSMFSLKFPSLLKFENDMHDDAKKSNLKTMFQVDNIASDTQMRAILDEVPTQLFRGLYKNIFNKIQRDKKLTPFEFLRISNTPYYQLLIDGTEFFSSSEVSCKYCNVKKYKKKDKKTGEVIESKIYSHSMLNAVIAHLDMKTVIPLMGEPIVKQEGESKYDCELNALKRFLKKFREDHPKLKVILTADALYATGSLIKLLKQYDISYIINVKPKKNKVLFQVVNCKEKLGEVSLHETKENIGDKVRKSLSTKFHYINKVPLDNESSLELKVNFLEYWESIDWTNTKGETCSESKHFSWVTDLNLSKNSITKIMRGGRKRWCIENEVFNTLKNHGYNYDRNYGHGYKNLSNNFAMLMMLAFTFDQILEMCSKEFKTLLKLYRLKSNIWEKMRYNFDEYLIRSWDFLVEYLIQLKTSDVRPELVINTS